MKRTLILLSLAALMQIFLANPVKAVPINCKVLQSQQDTLTQYTGKYKFDDRDVSIQIDLVNGELVGTQLWDGGKVLFKHLNADNFIIAGFNWAAKFLRDKDNKITGILVRGSEKLIKIN